MMRQPTGQAGEAQGPPADMGAGHPVPSFARVMILTLLLAGASIGLLAMTGAREMNHRTATGLELVRTDVARAAEALGPLNVAMARRPQTLGTVAQPGTAICLREASRNSLVCGTALPRFEMPFTQVERLESATGSMVTRSDSGRPFFTGSVLLADGRQVLSFHRFEQAHWQTVLPYLGLSGVILLLTGLFLWTMRQSRLHIAVQDGAHQYMLERLKLPEFSGCGPWVAAGDKVTLPGSLRAYLGYPRRDTRVGLRKLTTMIDEADTERALNLFTGKDGTPEGQVRFITASGDQQLVYVKALFDTDTRQGLVIPMELDLKMNERREAQTMRLVEALEALPHPFLMWDSGDRLSAWNSALERLFGLNHDAIEPGMTPEMVSGLVTKNNTLFSTAFTATEGDAPPADYPFDEGRTLRIVRRRTFSDGTLLIGQDVTDARTEANQRANNERELKMTVDILERSRTDLKNVLEQYQHEKKRAEDANRAKSEFLANVSHELRTPLNAINGFSELMREEIYGPLGHEKYRDYIRDINASGHHLLSLIDDILDLSTIEAGRVTIRPQQTDLERLLGEAKRFIDPQMRRSSITLRTMTHHVPSVWGDPRAIKQVLINLLTNAQKFTPEGGSVTVMTMVDLTSVTIMVSDTGIGIPKDHLHRLGAPFELVENHFSRRGSGTGLGLALSKSLMEAQRGILALISEPDRGTIAAITLPRREGVTVSLPRILKDRAFLLTQPKTTQQAETPAANVA